MECGPGEEAQVDFGTGAPVVGPGGKRRKTHVFRVVLSHSRKGYSEVVYRQTTESFVRCLENAFWHFGGVPQRVVLDNLRAAVTKADWFEPELNPQVHTGWRLAAREKPQSPKEVRDKADESRKLLNRLADKHKGTPWEVLARRERVTALGLEWQPSR